MRTTWGYKMKEMTTRLRARLGNFHCLVFRFQDLAPPPLSAVIRVSRVCMDWTVVHTGTVIVLSILY
jgi:hypothetical protein